MQPILLTQIHYEDVYLDIYASQYQSNSSLAIVAVNAENQEPYATVSINLQDYDIPYDKQKEFVFSHDISKKLRDIIHEAICEEEYRPVTYGFANSIIVKLNEECSGKIRI